jgi:hypothetical protein
MIPHSQHLLLVALPHRQAHHLLQVLNLLPVALLRLKVHHLRLLAIQIAHRQINLPHLVVVVNLEQVKLKQPAIATASQRQVWAVL